MAKLESSESALGIRRGSSTLFTLWALLGVEGRTQMSSTLSQQTFAPTVMCQT